MSTKENLTLKPLQAKDPLIGRWLSYLEDGRKRTKEVLQGVTTEMLEYQLSPFENSIGTLLAHIAAIEMDWLFAEILEQDIPRDVLLLLPPDVRDDEGRLLKVKGLSLEQHLDRLDKTRQVFITHLQTITLEDFLRPRSLERYDVSPEWVCNHLLQHEAGHRGHIALLRGRVQATLEAGEFYT
jgi:uncharacterized damage-inducible protein DinB